VLGHWDQQRFLQDLAGRLQTLACCAREKYVIREASALEVYLEKAKMEVTVVSPQLTGLMVDREGPKDGVDRQQVVHVQGEGQGPWDEGSLA